MASVAENIAALKKQIARIAKEHGRAADDAKLVAVSKKQDDTRIDAALAAGQRIFGENRVQEAEEHWQARRAQYPDLKLHLIGPLQTNKTKEAVALFDVIETIDRAKLADDVKEQCVKQQKDVVCFIQINTGNEPQKSGVSTDEFTELLNHCKSIGLPIKGLMAIPPVGEPSAVHFALLKKIAADHGLKDLSMGMSGDFEKAVPLGATYVRLGTAVFGEREVV